jgi:uncharacterized protein (TIGR03437 family)
VVRVAWPPHRVRISERFLALLIPCVGLAQTSAIQVGQGAPTPSVAEEFVQAYQRAQFFSLVATPPLTEVASYGSGGYRQEFQDVGRSGQRFALIRPANPNFSLGVNNVVRQVRPPITAVLNRSSIGVTTAGFPTIDTEEFFFVPSNVSNQQVGGSYQLFDKSFAIFVWSSPPLESEGSDVTEMTIADPVYAKWQAVTYQALGAPLNNATSVTSRFSTKATYQRFVSGAIYVLTSGNFSGRSIFVRRNVHDLYLANQAQAGFLGLPLSDETLLADGRRRQSFEGGTVEYTLTGTPVIKNAIQTVAIAGENPIRLTAGQSYPLIALLQTAAGETVEDREVFWTSNNGLVVSINGSGPRATLRALRGGTAVVRATAEGKSSAALTVLVTGICCALGEGAPTQAISQTFGDAALRNRLSLRTPLSSPVRRLGAGYIQEATEAATGARILLAKPDSAPLAFVVSATLLSAYDGFGGPSGPLGFPITDATPAGTQLFEQGALSGSPPRLVSGAILARWRSLGLENGALGFPLAAAGNVLTFTGNTVVIQRFANGLVVQFAGGALANRVFVVAGAIAAKYSELNGAVGLAGAPISDEFQVAGVFRQDFEGATLEYAAAGAVRVIEKDRKPVITVSPSSLLPGARYRVSIGGFPANARIRVTQGGSAADAFEAIAATGAIAYESVAAPSARPGNVPLRAGLASSPETFVETSYSVRSLAELRPQLSKVSGDQQSGAPATVLAAPLRVQLLDAALNPLANQAIRFEASPGGLVASASSVTDENGFAEANWRLPAQAGVALLAVQAAGQTVSFSARVAPFSIASFPRLTQSVEGFVGNSGQSIARKGSLLGALAAVVRFNQQRSFVPQDAGLADISDLNAFLKVFCVPSASGAPICDGFIQAGPGADPIPNPLRLNAYASGVLDFEALDTKLEIVRQSVFGDVPVILALELNRAGQAPAAHFVVAMGVEANGDLQIMDTNPEFARSTFSQYLSGLTTPSGAWQAKWAAAFRYVPRGAQTSAFFVHSLADLRVASAAPSCQPPLTWPAVLAEASSTGSTANFRLISCDGLGGSYRLDAPAPFLLNLTSTSSPSLQSIASGAVETSYSVERIDDAWKLQPMSLKIAADGVVHGASFQTAIAPGTIISLFGTGLPQSNTGPDLVEWNGQALPVFFSNGFQLNTALPETTPAGFGTLRITSRFGAVSIPIQLQETAPAIFTLGNGFSAVVNQDGSLNTPLSPAARGQVVVLFGTGFGAAAENGGLRSVVVPVSVSFQEQELRPAFAGLTPGFIGLYQVNVNLPATLRPGLSQTIRVSQGGVSSPEFRISLR